MGGWSITCSPLGALSFAGFYPEDSGLAVSLTVGGVEDDIVGEGGEQAGGGEDGRGGGHVDHELSLGGPVRDDLHDEELGQTAVPAGAALHVQQVVRPVLHRAVRWRLRFV